MPPVWRRSTPGGPQSAIGRIAIGDAVDLSTDNGDGTRWAGSVGRIAPEADASNRSATVFVEVRQRPDARDAGLLRPGQFLMGEVVSSSRAEALVLPRRAVDAGRVLIATPLSEGDPEPPATARSPMVIRSGEVDVSHAIEGDFDEVSPMETQWSVLRSRGATRGVGAGSVVVTSNLGYLNIRSFEKKTGELEADFELEEVLKRKRVNWRQILN